MRRETPGLRESRRAAVAVGLVGAYLQVVEWIDLGPWNHFVGGSNGQERADLLIGVLTVLLVAALWRGGRIATFGAVAATAAWGALQIATWWVPYFQGASPAWQRTYTRWFAPNLQVLPADATHLPPDANHLLLHILVAAAFCLALSAARASRVKS
jgi:hypothetical protein